MAASTPAQRWALGLAGVLTEFNNGAHHELGGRASGENTVKWCRTVLANSWNITDRESFDSALGWMWNVGARAECLEVLARLPASAEGDGPKEALARKHRAELMGRGLLAWDLGRFVAVVGWGSWAGFIPESEAWRYLHGAATWAQRRYTSWEEFGRHYEIGRLWWSGEADPRTAHVLRKLLESDSSPWVVLPWALGLGPAPAAPEPRRIKRTQCRNCGAPKQLPPLTGWVYCDHCGTLTDWDFRTACQTPGSALPGPAYEAVLASVKPRLDRARAARDPDAMRPLQIEIFTAWAEACPAALPPRAKQKPYREQYVRYMAEAAVWSELDAAWTQAGADIARLTQGIRFTGDPRKPRVAAPPFWALTEAVERQVRRGAELHAEHGVYDLHPDQIADDLQRQLTWSVYAQGWVPMLEPAEADKLLARTGLAGDYDLLPNVVTRLHHCGTCKADLATVPGAKCVVCESCGAKVDVHGDDVPCTHCGFSFSFPQGEARAKCPACDTMVARIA